MVVHEVGYHTATFSVLKRVIFFSKDRAPFYPVSTYFVYYYSTPAY